MVFFFFEGVGNFNLVFLRHYLTKCRCFCDHWKGKILDFLKVTLLLSLVHSWELQRALKWENIFWGGHPLALSQGQQKAWKAYISKWTTSGDPPVRSESLSDSYFSSNKLLLSAGYYETPCTYNEIYIDEASVGGWRLWGRIIGWHYVWPVNTDAFLC